MRSNRFGSILVAAMVVSLTGCSDDTTGLATAFRAILTGAAVLPADGGPRTGGSGDASVTISGGALAGSVVYSGVTVTAAHVHIGDGGDSGPVAWHICGSGGAPACGASPLDVGAGGLDAAQDFDDLVDDLRSNGTGTYVQLHDATGAALRGQLTTGQR